MRKPWHEQLPELAEEIRRDLVDRYPNLHLYINGRSAEVRGTFPVLSEAGAALDRYRIAIDLPPDYPNELPVVFEVGGRIPRISDRHMNDVDGTCCVFLPDARWEIFPIGAPFRQFLDGPVRDFFLGQSLVERGEPWPHGDWDHGAKGIVQYYQELLQTEDSEVVVRYIAVLALNVAKGHLDCPCGSGARLRNCCHEATNDLRAKIPPATARKSLDSIRSSGPKRRHRHRNGHL